MATRICAFSALVFISLVSGQVKASAFGLEMGMPILLIEEDENRRENPAPGTYVTKATPKPHPDFNEYIMIVGPTTGLCRVTAISRLFDTTIKGYDLKFEMSKLEERLSKKYGRHETRNHLVPTSKLTAPTEWMLSLQRGDREFAYNWESINGSMPDNISTISLTASAEDELHGRLTLQYTFSNFNSCMQEINSGEPISTPNQDLNTAQPSEKPKLDINYY